MTVDTDTAQRVGLRRQLAELAEHRAALVARLACIDKMIEAALQRLKAAE